MNTTFLFVMALVIGCFLAFQKGTRQVGRCALVLVAFIGFFIVIAFFAGVHFTLI